METKITFSANESNILKLKVGRCVVDSLNEQSFLEQINEGQYDLVRLTVPSEEEYIVNKLEAIKLAYFFSASITRYKTPIANIPVAPYIHHDLIFEEYDGTQTQLLFNLLKGTWGTYPLGYYRTPILNKIITKEIELEAVFEFYKYNNLKSNKPNNTMMFIKHNEQYVGFFALNIIDDRLESHIGGIIELYRTGGYFIDMQEYIKRYCLEHHLKYFCFGARNENRRVQYIFQKYGYLKESTDHVFHVVPMYTNVVN